VQPQVDAFGVKVHKDVFPISGVLFVAETKYFTKLPVLKLASEIKNALHVFPAQSAAGVALSYMTTTLFVRRAHQQVQDLWLYAIQQVGSMERVQHLVR